MAMTWAERLNESRENTIIHEISDYMDDTEEQEEDPTLNYQRMINGAAAPYSLQTIKTRESDHHHIVIGVRPAQAAR